jgi:hypothetical protein
MIAKEPKGDKHHYIPKFYLKQWTGDDRRLSEFSKPRNEIFHRRKFPDATGYERGLYTFDELPSPDADFLEHAFFLHADHRACQALHFLSEGNLDFDRPTRSAWSRFLMTLFHRTPERLAQIKKRVRFDRPGEMAQFRPEYESRRQPDSPTFDEFCASLTPADVQGIHIMVLRMIMDSELLGSKLNSMIWGTVKFDKGHHPLLTGDRPIVMTNGLNRPDSHIGLPISPRVLFVAVNEQLQMPTVIATACFRKN